MMMTTTSRAVRGADVSAMFAERKDAIYKWIVGNKIALFFVEKQGTRRSR
jgi:hypothetical protein